MAAAKSNFDEILQTKTESWEILEGKILFRTLATTIFKTFCKIIPHFQKIVEGIRDPDDNFKSEA